MSEVSEESDNKDFILILKVYLVSLAVVKDSFITRRLQLLKKIT